MKDEELQERLGRLDCVGRGIEAAFIAHLAEFDERGLYKKLGYSSLFAYCRSVFGHSESRAGKRIHAARAARRFPLILERLAAGRLHVSAVCILAAHLTEENHIALLDSAENRTKYELERLVAALAPRPDMKDVVMRLPAPPLATPPSAGPPPSDAPRAATVGGPVAEEPAGSATENPPPSAVPAAAPPPATVTPLSAERIRFAFTGPDGRRCGERRGLEVDHRVPFARGGSSSDPRNLRLLCRTHNRWAAEEAGLRRPGGP